MNDDTMIESIRAGLEQSRSGWTTESKKLFVLLKVLDELKALRTDLVPQLADAPEPNASIAQTMAAPNPLQNAMQNAGRK